MWTNPLGNNWRKLVNPVVQQRLDPRIAGIEFAAVGKIRQVRVLLDSEQIVQMAVELQARNHIDVPFAAVGDNLPYLVLGESRLGIQQRISASSMLASL